MDDGLEDFLDALALLRARQNGAGGVETDDVVNLAAHLVRLRPRQIDLVDDRDDLEVVVDGQVGIGQRLRLDALRGIDQQQGALAGRERSRHFVREVHVPGRVDEIEDVVVAVLGVVIQPDGVRLDRDPALALEVHGIQDLRLHLPGLQRAGEFQEAIRQRRLAVVDVGDDREVSDEARVHCW